ncbi:MAG: hypothetical protein ACRDHG_03025 [Anaerolineales bacterium]
MTRDVRIHHVGVSILLYGMTGAGLWPGLPGFNAVAYLLTVLAMAGLFERRRR